MTLPSIDLPQLHVDYVAAAQLQDMLQRDNVLAVFGFRACIWAALAGTEKRL